MPDPRDEDQPARACEGLAGMPVGEFAQVRRLAPTEAFRTAAVRVVLGLSPKIFLYWTENRLRWLKPIPNASRVTVVCWPRAFKWRRTSCMRSRRRYRDGLVPAALITASESDSGAERSRRLYGRPELNLSCAELIAQPPPQEDSIHIAGI